MSFLLPPPELEQVHGIEWRRFLVALRYGSVEPRIRAWQPGDHVFLVGPTGEGKTTMEVGILRLRNFVMALDPKGGDETLGKSGFERIERLPPPRKIQQQIAEGKQTRLIVGGAARTEREDQALGALMRDALDYVRRAGGWTIAIDELQVLSDQRMAFRLASRVEQLQIAARTFGTSVVTSFQALAWVPKSSVRQATAFGVLFPTRDRDMIKAVASAMGRDWRQIVFIMDKLARDERAEFCALVLPRSIRDPMLIVRADEV